MANEFDTGKGSESMSISISEMYISRQDDRYEIDVNNTKNKMQQAKKQYSSLLSSDTAVISEEGRKALQNKMSAFAKTGTTEVRRLSSVSSFGYCNDYEKILSELSNGCVSDEFVTENYSQGKVDAFIIAKAAKYATSRQKLAICQKEANETLFWLELLQQTNYLTEKQYDSLNADCIELRKIITSIILTTKQKKSDRS